MAATILYRDELKEYDFGPGHPFRGDRYENFLPFLKSRLNPEGHYAVLSAEKASDDDLFIICDKDYVEFNKQYFQAASAGWTYYYEDLNRYQSPDNRPMGCSGKIEEAARYIVGQAKLACDLVQSAQSRKVISIGGGLHHAKRRFGEGFCIYNDVAYTATYLLDRYQLKRVMILDTDAHAANGTAEYFRTDPRVLLVDIHQDPRTIYPGTGFASDVGADSGRGFSVNIPLPPLAGDDSYRLVFDQIVLPLAQEFRPQIIVRNGGSDPHFNDGLTNLGMTIAGFRMMGDTIRQMTDICGGKQIDLIASGYNKDVLPFAWLSLLSGIADFPITVEEPGPIPPRLREDLLLPETQKVVNEVKSFHHDYWKCFR